jgi:hypothetical protein
MKRASYKILSFVGMLLCLNDHSLNVSGNNIRVQLQSRNVKRSLSKSIVNYTPPTQTTEHWIRACSTVLATSRFGSVGEHLAPNRPENFIGRVGLLSTVPGHLHLPLDVQRSWSRAPLNFGRTRFSTNEKKSPYITRSFVIFSALFHFHISLHYHFFIKLFMSWYL